MGYGPLQKAVLQLSKQDNKINEIIVNYGLPNDKMSKGGFETLLRMIVGQQISVKAADAVWAKLKKIKADICIVAAYALIMYITGFIFIYILKNSN